IAEKFWGGEKAVDFSTVDGKALAAKIAQDRVYVQESMILCDLHWPAMMTSSENEDHTGDPALESQIFSAITGKEVDEQELLTYGERIFNLQRAILLRQGWKGRENDQILDYFFQEPLKQGEIFFNPDGIMPGPGGKLIS
ncbi:MAG: aldehyde ferredoxin oxidoreductase C-terminal domain-containing protein, partial [Dehalococcoidales bacterium]|nr:aldehyde ferredoxin oxidoreductase C-terminal domain-containing protein [Dehalococcoidales bacterium]